MKNKVTETEWEKYDVKDNPFDVMLVQSLDIVREILWGCQRHRREGVDDSLWINAERLQRSLKILFGELSKLNKLSSDAVRVCRETSVFAKAPDFNKLDALLLNIMDNLDTKYTQSGPCRNMEFEKAKLGEQSEEYKRLLELQEMCFKYNLFKSDPTLLSQSKDVMIHDKDCVKFNWMSFDRLSQIKQFIQQYNLKYSEISYMQSFLKKCRQ